MGNGKWQKTWEVPSESKPDKKYRVSRDWNGNYACHCWPYLKYHKTHPNYQCKHIHEIIVRMDKEEGRVTEPRKINYAVGTGPNMTAFNTDLGSIWKRGES